MDMQQKAYFRLHQEARRILGMSEEDYLGQEQTFLQVIDALVREREYYSQQIASVRSLLSAAPDETTEQAVKRAISTFAKSIDFSKGENVQTEHLQYLAQLSTAAEMERDEALGELKRLHGLVRYDGPTAFTAISLLKEELAHFSDQYVDMDYKLYKLTGELEELKEKSRVLAVAEDASVPQSDEEE